MDDTQNKNDVQEEVIETDSGDNESDDVVSKLMAQNEDLNNKWKRAVADYQNLEKQVRREKSEFMQFASMNVVVHFLPILDNLEQALAGMKDEEKKSGWAVGVLMTVKQFRDLLKDQGLTEIKTEGEVFDAHKMEPIDTIEGEKDKVITVVKKGYEGFGKVIRPAQVIIGKGE
ncbi:MAG: nucleotide exchange factor GrpE [bacterium]|nr:nucleotide exchange factor GrpE [bacterium]